MNVINYGGNREGTSLFELGYGQVLRYFELKCISLRFTLTLLVILLCILRTQISGIFEITAVSFKLVYIPFKLVYIPFKLVYIPFKLVYIPFNFVL